MAYKLPKRGIRAPALGPKMVARDTSISDDAPPPPIGDNSKLFGIPAPEVVRELLKDELTSTLASIKDQADVCKALTKPIESDEQCTTAGDAFKVFKGMREGFEGRRVAAKEPWLAGSRAVDGYFVPVRDRIDEVLRALESEVGGYLRRKEAEERARKEAEARRLREAEERQRQKAEAARRAAEDAQRKADEAKTKAAREKAQREAEAQRVNANVAEARADTTASMADRAEVSAAQDKPAEFARTRGEGSLSTLQEVWGFEIEDFSLMDFNGPLRAFIKRDAIEAALKAFVKINKDQTPIAGVRFFKGAKANIR